MKVAIVTSSRADYGIFKPLILALNELNEWELEIIVTGSHLSLYHGDSYNELKEDFPLLKYELVPALLTSHDPCSVALNYGLVVMRFAEFWKDHLDYKVVFVLGDRYELAGVVAAGIPFQIPFAHLHGGEVTLGAIDQSYRDFITIVSKWNFTAEKGSYERVLKLKLPMENQNVFNVGSLAIDALRSHEDCSTEVFYEKTGLHLNDDFILVTVHPETLDLGGNLINSEIFSKVIEFQVNHSNSKFLVSLPNTDPASEIWRRMWIRLAKLYSHKIFCVEHLGVKLYYSAMRNCQFMLGNTSSGIIEAASLRCWVINLGKRQLGRAVSENVIQCEYDFDSIMSAIDHVLGRKFRFEGENIYGNGSSAQIIINLLKALN
jgi:GDP/UDP-N,N'-diacetylbacillosamine 2-epimerase (hydrolysing)